MWSMCRRGRFDYDRNEIWLSFRRKEKGAERVMQIASVFATAVLGSTLLVLSLIDIRTHRLPDSLTLPLAAIGLSLPFWMEAGLPFELRLVGTAIGFASLWAIAALFRRLRGYDGLGLGDAKLLGAAGAWLGPYALAPLMLIATCVALIAIGGAVLAGQRVSARTAIPFGPFLCLGFFTMWMAQQLGWSFP
jgi:leader peptidase (prepilin peptidase) / N-methyltransferase